MSEQEKKAFRFWYASGTVTDQKGGIYFTDSAFAIPGFPPLMEMKKRLTDNIVAQRPPDPNNIGAGLQLHVCIFGWQEMSGQDFAQFVGQPLGKLYADLNSPPEPPTAEQIQKIKEELVENDKKIKGIED